MEGRQSVVERLLAAHEAFFDVERDHVFAGRTFPGYAEFHSAASQYVLVKRAKLWEAKSNEYLFFWSCARLTAPELGELVAFMKTEALAKVQLVPDHMCSYLSLVVVADECEEGIGALVKSTRFRKNFALGLKGWADLRLAVVDLAAGRVYANTQGKPLVETLAANAFACGAASGCDEGEPALAAAGDTSSASGAGAAAEASAVRASSTVE